MLSRIVQHDSRWKSGANIHIFFILTPFFDKVLCKYI